MEDNKKLTCNYCKHPAHCGNTCTDETCDHCFECACDLCQAESDRDQ